MKTIQNGLLQLKILELQNGMQNFQPSKKTLGTSSSKQTIEHEKNFISFGKIKKN